MKVNSFNIIGIITTAFVTFFSLHIFMPAQNDPIVCWSPPQNGVAPMPLVLDTDPFTASHRTDAPVEDRGLKFRRWLAASVKISVRGSSGSGTIVFYNPSTQYAYVSSCGHLWSGTRSAEEIKRNPVNCKVIAWYHNDVKLDSPKTYDAQVLYWSNNRGYDTSLLRFKPDWIPNYFPIAPRDHPIEPGVRLHSLGCDGGREVAHYAVEYVEMRGGDLITKHNSPRPGRSGGGLMDDGYYVGTCWGTSDRSGRGIGYFTPLGAIHKIAEGNGYDWILRVPLPGIARLIPVYDWNNPGQKYPKNYIPLPERLYIPLPR